MTYPLLAFLQTSTPGDCLLTGLCGLLPIERPVASGVMWLAAGLVAGGVWGLRRTNSRS